MALSWRRKAALAVVGLGFVGTVAAMVVLWRGVMLPAPDGPHRVGRANYHLIDPSRPEIFSDAPDDSRELMVSVHYPAVPEAREPLAPYADGPVSAGIAEAFATPRFIIDSFHSHALQGPAVRAQEGGYPVIIFSPGFGQPPLFYTETLEQLASHGFVVVGVSHPFSNGVTIFPDGRVVKQNEAGSHADVSLGQDDGNAKVKTAESTPPANPPEDVGSVWVRDVRFVLDELTRLNRDDELLAGKLDLSKVGIFGHSFGGATAARTVQVDPRFLAGINMDGTDFKVTDEGPIERPFLWLSAPPGEISDAMLAAAGKDRAWADQAMRMHRERTDGLLNRASDGARVTVRGAEHQTFTSDFTLFGTTFPWSWLVPDLGVGAIPGPRAVKLVDQLVLQFFQKHLQGQPAPLLEGSSKEYPEVELQIHKK